MADGKPVHVSNQATLSKNWNKLLHYQSLIHWTQYIKELWKTKNKCIGTPAARVYPLHALSLHHLFTALNAEYSGFIYEISCLFMTSLIMGPYANPFRTKPLYCDVSTITSKIAIHEVSWDINGVYDEITAKKHGHTH